MTEPARQSLSGNLTVREVPGAWRRLVSDLPEEIDLAAVARTDSSALALLLECRALGADQGREILIVNPPESLRVLARLTDVSELLGWNRTSGNHEE